ncbi:MAG: hypothetical protein Q9179_002030 [Wetmoreana sp. 5 TL-2023]
MASSVFFRFKSQKEPTRVAFDGTGISVFELKREIILSNRLGDGTDFELIISSEDTGEEYDDDTYSIPRSTTVIAKRMPASKPGRGGAARYVSGKMPQNAKTSHRIDAAAVSSASTSQQADGPNGLSDMNGAQTEEEKIAAMFKLGADQWAQQQREMANATPVYRSGPSKSKQANVPDRPPPSGYVCYRCGEKGHWIQACPTNDDPSYVNRPRVKRTTGIPRSFLKTVEKPTLIANDGTVDETKQPTGVMINADGEWVVAEPDKASWDQYQARAKVSAAAQEAAAQGNKELQERGLECPVDKRLFIEPSQTPCCHKTYCLECITNALLENDLRCPHCSTENILLDDVKPDEQMAQHVREYEHEQQIRKSPNATKSSKEDASNGRIAIKQETTGETRVSTKSMANAPSRDVQTPPLSSAKPSETGKSTSEASKNSPSRKRPADTSLTNPTQKATKQETANVCHSNTNTPLPSTSGNPGSTQAAEPMGLPVPISFMDMPMTMMPMMPMVNGTFDPMTMANPFMAGGSTNWNAMWNGGYPQQPMGMAGGGYLSGMNGQFGARSMQIPINNGFGMPQGMNTDGFGRGIFSNQQRNHFAGSKANEEDSAYFRKPVNPHRHQARRNANRPTDYREI